MTEGRVMAAEADWRVLGDGLSAWFGAGSLTAGAELLGRVVELTGGNWPPDVDLRASGVRVRIGADARFGEVELARGVSAVARELGLAGDPAGLQVLRLAVHAGDRAGVMAFWRTTFGYDAVGDDVLVDSLRRDPAVSFRQSDEPRPLRNRIHIDVSRGAEAVEAVKAALEQEAYGAYGLTLADVEGNEVDLVPGEGLPDTSDWQTQFGAMVFYPTASPVQASRLVSAVAKFADDAGLPILVDVRPDGVTIDSGKDQWEDEGVARPEFVELAGRIEAAAHDLGLTADPTRLRFVQLALDAVDGEAVRAFWRTLLGYENDPRTGLTEIYDPRRLNPVIMFQSMDAADGDRRRQRNRIHFDLDVPHDQLRTRIDAALAAGGRIVTESPGRCLLTDPEGNEVEITTPET